MSRDKELQAFEGIKKALASHLVRQVGNAVDNYTFEKAYQALQYDTDLQTIESYLRQPSFEDAVKVVEKMIEKNEVELSQHEADKTRRIDLQIQNEIYGDVLAKLREMGEKKPNG